mgnify:CR=1 FL=1
MTMADIIEDGKYVELTYKILDKKTGSVLTLVEFPLGYVHGANEVLAPAVAAALAGKAAGDVIEVPIDGTTLFGERDESLVFTDRIENVPEDYREIGMTIVMENEKGEAKKFTVTRMDDRTLTVDGNHPLCGRELIFRLEVLTVRDATEEEIEAGGSVNTTEPDIKGILKEF